MLIATSLFVSVLTMPNAYSVTSFGGLQNLSLDSEYSTDPQVVVSGSNVYVVWTNVVSGVPDILFKVSTDGGTFSSPVSLSSDPGITPGLVACDEFNFSFCRGVPDIAVSGNNVYVIWQDVDPNADNGIGDPDPLSGDDEIFYRVSTNGGVTFSPDPTADPAINLSNDLENSLLPIIDATGAFVHAVWRSSDTTNSGVDISYRRSVDSGATFSPDPVTDPPINLSTVPIDGFSVAPSMVLSGDNVYVVWHTVDSISFSADIYFQASNDNGATFNGGSPIGLPVDIANSVPDFSDSLFPTIAAAGSNVYVAWEDNRDGIDNDILYRKSTDGGATFSPDLASPPADLSNNDSNSIAALLSTNSDGSKVYLAWQDGDGFTDDIQFKKSTDSGNAFDVSATNLSANAGFSSFPVMDASGDNVFVTWSDDTLGGDTDVFFKSSDDGGSTFSAFQDLSDNDVASDFQQVASSGGDVYVVWRDGVGDLAEISFVSGTPNPIALDFDQTQYKLSDIATITLTDVPGTGPKSVTITSSEDGVGFSRDLTETVVPGTYTGTITFTTGSSDAALGILQVAVGGSITADFGGTPATASIFPRTPEFQFATYTLSNGAVGSAPVIITVTDQISFTNPLAPETIAV